MTNRNLLVKCICLFLLIFIFLFSISAQTPGGVSANLTSWFKANTTVSGNILTSTGNNISTWKSDINAASVSQATQSKQPVFEAAASGIANFNFNPVVQFNAPAATVLYNSSTTNNLLGTAGTVFIVCNSRPSTSGAGGNGGCGLTYYSNSNYRYQVKPSFRMQVGTGSLGWTADVAAAGGPALNAPAESAQIQVMKSMSGNFRGRRNADSVFITHSGQATYFPNINSGLYFGGDQSVSTGFPYNGALSEIITYDISLSNTDINKVESYLAVKYGITLSQQSAYGPANSNYTASDGTMIWDATANNGYSNNITGIGKDDVSGLLQKQSKSVQNNSLLYIYKANTGGNFPAMNTDNTSSFATDKTFLLVGDNGLPNTVDQCVFNSKALRMQRTWKVSNIGNISTVTIAVDNGSIDPNIKNLVVSNDPTFPLAATTILPLLNANGKQYVELTLNHNSYFSFATDSIVVTMAPTQPTCTNPNGGSIATTITGGTGVYGYSWNPSGQTTANLTNAGAGNYVLTITQGTCQAVYPAITIIAPPGPLSPIVNAISVCPANTAILQVQSPNPGYTYSWYTSATGGTALATGTSFTTPVINNNTTYYVEAADGTCVSIRTPVLVSVTIITDAIVSPETICSGTSATLTVQNLVAGQVYNWYAGATGGTALATGISYTSPVLSTTTTYYVEAVNGTCTGPHVPVTVSISSITNAIVNPVTICSGNTATLTVQNAVSAQQYSWYSAAAGGVAIATGTSFTTPLLTINTTYYIEASNSSCGGPRTPVTVNVTAITDPVVNPLTICIGTTATLTIQNPVAGQTYNWYATSSGGVTLATGINFTSPVLSTATTYYVEAANGSCIGIRTSVTVNTTSITDPTVAPLTICQGTSATLTVQNTVPGQTYTWYSTSTGGIGLATGVTYTTASINTSTTYYVEASNGTCTGVRVPVTVNINSVPPPAAAGTTVCPGTSAQLSISNPNLLYTYSWYNAPSGGTLLGSGTSYTTPTLQSATNYYISASDGVCSSVRTTVVVNITPALNMPTVVVTSATQSMLVFSWQPIAGAIGYQVSIDGGPYTLPSSGQTGTTHTINGLHPMQVVNIDVIALADSTGCGDSHPGHGKGITPGTSFYMPTAFTPNADQLNDVIKPQIPGGAQMLNFLIYNRWGQPIFSTSINGNGWDGKLKDMLQPTGVYVWTCKYMYIGKVIEEHGSFVLIH